MQAIAVSELRANLMRILRKVEFGSTIAITSRGKVVAKLVPADYSREVVRSKLDEISKTATINDIVSPIDVQWEASSK